MTRGKPDPDADRAAYGFSPHDWLRIRDLAETTTATYTPAALDDLSVPYRVQAVMADGRRYFAARQIGTWRGRAILVTPIVGERGLSAWVRRVERIGRA